MLLNERQVCDLASPGLETCSFPDKLMTDLNPNLATWDFGYHFNLTLNFSCSCMDLSFFSLMYQRSSSTNYSQIVRRPCCLGAALTTAGSVSEFICITLMLCKL